jgi:P pilus assembly chaperone PapD
MVSPQVLSLQPAQQRDVRVSIRVPNNLKPGTYREHLNVKMLEVAQQINSGSPEKENNVGIHLNLLMQIAPVIYGDTGTNEAKLQISCQLDKNNLLTLNASNKTPWHFNGTITGYGADETKPLFTVNGIVFRESSTSIASKWKANISTVNLVWRNDRNPDADVQKTTCNLK